MWALFPFPVSSPMEDIEELSLWPHLITVKEDGEGFAWRLWMALLESILILNKKVLFRLLSPSLKSQLLLSYFLMEAKAWKWIRSCVLSPDLRFLSDCCWGRSEDNSLIFAIQKLCHSTALSFWPLRWWQRQVLPFLQADGPGLWLLVLVVDLPLQYCSPPELRTGMNEYAPALRTVLIAIQKAHCWLGWSKTWELLFKSTKYWIFLMPLISCLILCEYSKRDGYGLIHCPVWIREGIWKLSAHSSFTKVFIKMGVYCLRFWSLSFQMWETSLFRGRFTVAGASFILWGSRSCAHGQEMYFLD